MGYIIYNDYILDCPAYGYLSVFELIKNIIQLNVLSMFLNKFISEACVNFTELRQIVCKLYKLCTNFSTAPCIPPQLNI